MITMPDGVLPDDYSETISAVGDAIRFAGEVRVLVGVENRFHDRRDPDTYVGTLRFGGRPTEVVQSFACGSERRLWPTWVDSQDRLVPMTVSVERSGDPGVVGRRHAPVRYERQAVLDNLGISPAEAAAALRTLEDGLSRLHGTVRDTSHETALHGPIRPPPVVHESPGWIVYLAETPIVAASLGHGTAWCTAYPTRPPIWSDYVDGELYVIVGRGSRRRRRTRYQIHVDPHGSVEAERHDLQGTAIADIEKRNPGLAPWLVDLRSEVERRRSADRDR